MEMTALESVVECTDTDEYEGSSGCFGGVGWSRLCGLDDVSPLKDGYAP